jgi:hypothetical protein
MRKKLAPTSCDTKNAALFVECSKPLCGRALPERVLVRDGEQPRKRLGGHTCLPRIRAIHYIPTHMYHLIRSVASRENLCMCLWLRESSIDTVGWTDE